VKNQIAQNIVEHFYTVFVDQMSVGKMSFLLKGVEPVLTTVEKKLSKI
jgi:hypothetical protein